MPTIAAKGQLEHIGIFATLYVVKDSSVTVRTREEKTSGRLIVSGSATVTDCLCYRCKQQCLAECEQTRSHHELTLQRIVELAIIVMLLD
jgi:hypothetical protein